MEEIWKDVVGYEGWYQVSNLGNVRSVNRISTNSIGICRKWTSKPIKQQKNHKGYLLVKIGCGNGHSWHTVHRLVMEAFDCVNKLMTIDHLNGDKQDNRLENLQYVTLQENILRHHNNSKTKTGKAGVHFDKGRYRVRITEEGTRKNIGYFSTIEDASDAFDKEYDRIKNKSK